ncbi:methylmalonyl-CoA mutase subunit beta [Aureisphaera galaxeae]|uniref:methylmalonyl-CoA mutase subunit beta n=1 Tax=Aureisphaera galaxeae TaxID=1538023 RepID=UPI002350A0BB|nr:methylmalonyl-CoA mutase subunit beta [Aureisphaera galaxeae]MDC8003501.1 methylmalonyl-CoA mutase subunit beta [Aureisphaera galaxeae]
MSNSLFQEFDAVSAKAWKQKIQVDLKGADYNETLIWQSLEGIHVKPFYHADEAETPTTGIPGHPGHWDIGQSIFIDKEEVACTLALDAVARGAEAIIFHADKEFQVEKVLKGFPFQETSLHFQLNFLNKDFFASLISYLTKNKAKAFYHVDILGNLARSGNWFHNLTQDHEIVGALLTQFPDEALLSIDTSLYQNAGANRVQQLAYGIAHLNEYLNHYFGTGSTNNNLKVTFNLAIGPNYFFEIAKIRALRKLVSLLAAEYGIAIDCHVVAIPSKRNKTLYDYNVNMLRTTTECMSAVLGGADTVSNLPYDAIYHKSNEFGERISRNQLLILKAESYFDMVSNVADGSYYVESLTDQLGEKALELFKEIEKNGGLFQQLKAGTLQKKIKESGQKEAQLFEDGTLVLVGTNKYENPNDRMGNDLELFPFVKTNPRKTLIEPIIERRIPETLEKQRLENE